MPQLHFFKSPPLGSRNLFDEERIFWHVLKSNQVSRARAREKKKTGLSIRCWVISRATRLDEILPFGRYFGALGEISAE
jgi:hypothetical protein